ncbi:MAG: DUF6029 family protein [Candidatus Cloacimonetes bacterium]|nr:DUF6029 family protein [Candidatus Cloacimonadota bacterium]MDD4155435.1 DUF6029 family protein [Candidatus Cloacimonadota bacterium]
MKIKYIMITLLSLFISQILLSQNVSINGENNAKFIHRTVTDSLKNYFENELKLRLDYKYFAFGMTFKAELPKYDQYQAIGELNPNQVSYEWTDRYAQVNYDKLFLKAGTIEESFGAGIILRSWNDTDLDRDKRLEGAQAKYQLDNYNVSAVYGVLKNDVQDINIHKNDIVAGIDFEMRPLDILTFGASSVQYKQKDIITNNQYTHYNLYGSRVNLMTNYFELYTEYTELRREHNLQDNFRGYALYSVNSIYFGDFTLSSGYKRYNRFSYALSDLPTLNHYDELLSSYAVIDFEEGLLGEIRYIPNMDNQYLISYAESWNKNFTARHSNLFAEYKKNFNTYSLTLDFELLEKKQDDLSQWEKEIKPTVYLDFYNFKIPTLTKLSWSYLSEEHFNIEKQKHTPYLQLDLKLNKKFAVSVFSEYEFTGKDDFGKNSAWIGTELVTSISDHSEIKLFLGKEKGGKVCRNGVCQFQAPFEGLRLSLNTRF